MRIALAMLGIFFMSSEVLGAEPNASNFQIRKGRMMIAQSFCEMCRNERTYCVIKCNGSGTCIQNCEDDYRLCVERACRR